MVQAIDMAAVDKALEGFVIPPRPDMLKKIQAQVESDEPDLKLIAQLINQDIGVAGFTLKVVNSSLFSLSRNVTSIEHACMFLGLERVIKLVNSIVLRFTLSKGDEAVFTQQLWNSSSSVANAAMLLAEHLDFEPRIIDDCYTLGLFHNAGTALINQQFDDYPDILARAYRQNDLTITEYEEAQYQTSHEVLGFLIAQSWGLSNELCSVIAYHHHPQVMLATGEATEKELFSVLKLSEHMVGLSSILAKAEQDWEWEKYHHQILDVLHIEEFQLLDLGEMLHEKSVDNIYHAG